MAIETNSILSESDSQQQQNQFLITEEESKQSYASDSDPQKGNMDIRFASPLLEFGYPPAVEDFEQGKTTEKPLLLYVPGFDGTYLSAFFQYPELHSLFEIRCLVSSMDDRSTFNDLKQTIVEFLKSDSTNSDSHSQEQEHAPQSPEHQQASTSSSPSTNIFSSFLKRNNNNNDNNNNNNNGNSNHAPKQKTSRSKNTGRTASSTSHNHQGSQRPVYLAGESFGGILALEVALALTEDSSSSSSNNSHNNINLQGLVLVNAATCFDRSRLAAEGPPVGELPPMLYFFGILKLLPMFLDKISLPQFLAIIQGKALPSLIDNPMREAYMGRLAFALPFLLKFMPQDTFLWRLEQWLSVGCKRMETQLAALQQQQQQQQQPKKRQKPLRTLIVAGENDLTLPSIAEAERLAQIFSPNCHVHVVQQVGHANTCGTCLDLAAEMRSHFAELQEQQQQQGSAKNNSNGTEKEALMGRTQMKQVAREGEGIYFGMEPRYDGKAIGLSPLSYWSREYYRKMEGQDPR
ncbi:expressed unknown protein [Seminavis robusta]|uniref:Uncharacterized protein n=1 Tax=Seminavis robusta TaxID=568900 RepID=A0A9N8DHP1_9STRA|nr:expressed unknown protein [Seminavis robusta]|eukprot:Sro71_g039230.1 n/a (519) ;mRNA; r:12364-13920